MTTVVTLIGPAGHGTALADEDTPATSAGQHSPSIPRSDLSASPPPAPIVHEEDILRPADEADTTHEDTLSETDLATDALYSDHPIESLLAEPTAKPELSSTQPHAAGLWLGESYYDPLGIFFSHRLPGSLSISARSWLVYGLGYDRDFVEIERSDLSLDLSEHSFFTKLQFLYYPVDSSSWWFVIATGYLSYNYARLSNVHLYRLDFQHDMYQLNTLSGGLQIGMGLHKPFSRLFKKNSHPHLNPAPPRYFVQLQLAPLTLHHTLFKWGDDNVNNNVLDVYFDLTSPTSKLISPLHFHVNYAVILGYYL